MRDYKVIYTQGNYRILEQLDDHYDITDLKGDCYNPEVNKDIPLEVLNKEELAFNKKVERDGVYGYILEKWNPNIGVGWEHVDSCWGFIGTHEVENHYIVDELKMLIK